MSFFISITNIVRKVSWSVNELQTLQHFARGTALYFGIFNIKKNLKIGLTFHIVMIMLLYASLFKIPSSRCEDGKMETQSQEWPSLF